MASILATIAYLGQARCPAPLCWNKLAFLPLYLSLPRKKFYFKGNLVPALIDRSQPARPTMTPFSVFHSLRPLIAALAVSVALGVPAFAADPLVSVDWLKDHRADANVVVLDVRSAIDGGGAKAYEAAHIPGAIHSDYDKDGWRVTRNDIAFMLPSVAQLEKLVGDLGIDEDTHVVVVPAGVSFTDFGSAARVYWTLKVAGLKDVSLLNGGVAAWKKAGLPLEGGASKPSPKIFTASFSKDQLAELGEVQQIEQQGGATLLDARPTAYFNGKEIAPTVKAYGHIPNAISLDSAKYYDAKTNTLKPAAELAAISAAVPAGPVVSYCNTGHWAATDWFVLHEVLGRSEVKLYDGSMTEWSSDPRRPVESSRTKWDDLKKTLKLGS
jgi:thiosulfate/3-mercaptopyruvate sulfurtransferase